MTEKLYDIDSHLYEFTANALSVEKRDDFYLTVLDRTAFFPEGGGQASDIGCINGVFVDYVFTENDIIYHRTKESIALGEVKCAIDSKRRFGSMQNHSGEHIVSGIINKKYGFDNVGFHLGKDFVTLDFNGLLNREQLDEIEYEANQKIWQNVKFRTYYPSKAELELLNYRSKIDIDGDIRIVEIENTDVCACCAPHVNEAGEIGIIKLLDFEKLRGGIRIYMKCGEFALADYRSKYENALKISTLLAAKQENIADAVLQLQNKLAEEKYKISNLNKKLINFLISGFDINRDAIMVDDFEIKELQMLADGLHKTYIKTCGAFSKTDNGYNFAICGESNQLDELFSVLKQNLNVRGGGRNGMVQGTIIANKEDLEKYFKF